MFLFRADGNASVGAGHVMRCLSIADAARDNGMSWLHAGYRRSLISWRTIRSPEHMDLSSVG